MPIYPGTKVKPTGETVETLMANMPEREVFVKDTDGQLMGTGMRMLPDNTLLAPDGFAVESGSIDFGDVITMSESSGFLGIRNNLYNAMYQIVDYGVPRTSPSLSPSIFQLLEAENMTGAQVDDSVVLTANPLVFNYTTALNARTNSITFRSSVAMSNVRIKITKSDVNVALKYLPTKSVWSLGTGGMNFVVGDNIIDFKDSPVPLSAGVMLTFEIRANTIGLKGNSSGIPYFTTMVQRGQFATLPLSSEVTASAVRDKLVSLTSPNKLPKSAIQDSVLTVNGQFGDVVVPSQVNSDWNSTSGLSQILNKPVMFSGSYTDLSNKPSNFPPSAHTHVIGDVVGLQIALDNKITVGASIPYATLTGTPVVVTNNNQLTNGSNYITATQSPVQSVNGQTGAVSLTIPNAQIQSDWNQVTTTALDYIKNKPSIPVVSYPVTSVNTKTGAVVLTPADVGAIAVGASIPYSTLTGIPTIPAAQVQTDWNAVSGLGVLLNKPVLFNGTFTALTGKPTTLSGYGITDAYPLASNPAGYLTGITSTQVTTALGYTPYNATNPSAYINQAGARTAISLTTTGTSGASTYNSSTGVLNVPVYTPPTPVQASATRALNTAFQISSTRNSLVMYSVQITVSASITGGQNGDVILEIASDSGFTANVQTVAIAGLGQTYTLAIALAGVQPQTNVVSGFVPAGYYARLRTVSNTGTPVFTYRAGQEILM